MRLSLLGSGSSGNVAFVESAGSPGGPTPTRVLVDAGLSRVELERRLSRLRTAEGLSLSLARIDAVLVTHEHRDHAGCAATLGRPLHATAGTRRAAGFAPDLDVRLVRADQPLTIGALTVMPVGLPHDADETVGYVLSDGRSRVGILTDCGHDAPEVAAAYAGCDVLVLETNHDVTMLRYGPYPPSLKRRVGGSRGHLSNDQAAALLKAMLKHGRAPRLVIAAHLSQANNRPILAKSALDRVIGRPGRVLVASQMRGSPTVIIEPERVRIEAEPTPQLAFDFQRPSAPIDEPSARPGRSDGATRP